MFRRVLCGLAVVGMMGSVAFGAPILTVTDNVIINDQGIPYTPITYEPGVASPPMSYNPGDTLTLYVFIEKLDEAVTPVGDGINAVVASLGLHMEESGVGLAFSNPTVRYGMQELNTLGWIADTGFSGNFVDEDITPDVDGDEDWGWSRFTGTSADIGAARKFVGTIDVECLAGSNDLNSDVQIEPARAPNPDDTTMTQTTILDDGTQPDDVVINMDIQGLVGVPLVVPEPTTMALLLMGFGGGLIARRRR